MVESYQKKLIFRLSSAQFWIYCVRDRWMTIFFCFSFLNMQEEGWLIGVKDNTGEKKMFPANFTRPLWVPHCRKRKEITTRPRILKYSFWTFVILFYVFMFFVYLYKWDLKSVLAWQSRYALQRLVVMTKLFYKLNNALKFLNIYFFYAPWKSSLKNIINNYLCW